VGDLKMIVQFGSLNTGVIINAESPFRLGQLVRRDRRDAPATA
jgi:hypothetical protein